MGSGKLRHIAIISPILRIQLCSGYKDNSNEINKIKISIKFIHISTKAVPLWSLQIYIWVYVFSSNIISCTDFVFCQTCINHRVDSRHAPSQWETSLQSNASHWLGTNIESALNQISGPRLNIKTVLYTYGDFHVKDKTAVRTSYL